MDARVNVLMVTPHLPPHQAANALLPRLLGDALAARGHRVRYLTFGAAADTPELVHVPRRARALRATRRSTPGASCGRSFAKPRSCTCTRTPG
jgi:hypothetical protein